MTAQAISLQNNTKQGINEIVDLIMEDVATSFRMDLEEKKRFMEKNIARLIAAIPFLADCNDAARTAVSHLGIYVLSCRETKYHYNAVQDDNESIFERLRLINNFKGGDTKIIEKGMNLLTLIMLTDYKQDIELDAAIQKYNPLSDGSFDYDNLRNELIQKINEVDCPQMDEIYNQEVGTRAFWAW